MKKILTFICLTALLAGASCTKMDLYPKDKAASENWFQNKEQFEMSLNALLHHMYWPMERNEWGDGEQIELDLLTDDGTNRTSLSRYLLNTIDGSFPLSTQMWNISYKGINRCNKILRELPKCALTMSEEDYNRIYANALFYRACFYSRIIVHFGNPVMVPEEYDFDKAEDLEKAYSLGRSDKWPQVDSLIKDFEEAASLLPVSYSPSEVTRATKGAAWGMEARFALHMAGIRDFDQYGQANRTEAEKLYAVAAAAAKNVISLNKYVLHSDFGQLFRMSTKNSPEGIFILPRSKALSAENKYEYLYKGATTAKLSRLSGAATCCTCCPSWDLFCAFYDNQGKPIDESTVYNPNRPFKNRDPRCTYTIVEHGTQHLGVIYEPHFDTTMVYSTREGKMVENADSRTYRIPSTVNQYASYNGLVLKKHVDDDWLSPFEAENDKLILRYADVLLMYAEAQIELGNGATDPLVLECMNRVRARAYKADWQNSGQYPKIFNTDKAYLRRTLRAERRMEFAFENLRLYDIWRWRIGETVLNYANYGLPAKNQKTQSRYIDDNQWFFGAVPQIDDNDCPVFNAPVVKGTKNFFVKTDGIDPYAVQLTQRVFEAPKLYLWPIPITTTNVMKNVKNNTGY